MEDVEEFADERQKAWCAHCGAVLVTAEVNWDHAPSQGLLDRSLPPHVPQVEVCTACNNGFSLDEEYFRVFLSCVLTGSTEPNAQPNEAIGRALARSPKLRARIDAARSSDSSGQTVWAPEAERVRRVIVKNARGHAFYEIGEPMLDEPVSVGFCPLPSLRTEQRAAFEDAAWEVWPEVGSRMMTRLISAQDMEAGWIVVQDGVYRYAVFQDDGIVVRSVIREYLATETRWT